MARASLVRTGLSGLGLCMVLLFCNQQKAYSEKETEIAFGFDEPLLPLALQQKGLEFLTGGKQGGSLIPDPLMEKGLEFLQGKRQGGELIPSPLRQRGIDFLLGQFTKSKLIPSPLLDDGARFLYPSARLGNTPKGSIVGLEPCDKAYKLKDQITVGGTADIEVTADDDKKYTFSLFVRAADDKGNTVANTFGAKTLTKGQKDSIIAGTIYTGTTAGTFQVSGLLLVLKEGDKESTKLAEEPGKNLTCKPFTVK